MHVCAMIAMEKSLLSLLNCAFRKLVRSSCSKHPCMQRVHNLTIVCSRNIVTAVAICHGVALLFWIFKYSLCPQAPHPVTPHPSPTPVRQTTAATAISRSIDACSVDECGHPSSETLPETSGEKAQDFTGSPIKQPCASPRHS
jgi:hypothetical protein